jgi:hypothetical protein
MFDFTVRLRENAHLLALLTHYAQLGSEDRTIWHARLMQLEQIDSKELTSLHGELIAFNWIEQNTGNAKYFPDGTLGCCYRITHEGLREYRRIHGVEVIEDTPEPTEPAQPKLLRKKQKKNEHHALATSS